ncbi:MULTISPECIES: ImmA/IrrE family metallo-endopeptidase [Actinotignum]|uniref:ImmA/IrrE family metallo-endopeptidase n=1 Tax=Actinotignum timonense TaxID=1870995 RepID=A0AAW9H9S5_9ACTO|nr:MULTISPECIES: ImmA/IrrE family metallo-endopeptidase [Actinotignum]MBS5748906.1 ImmA/IrrE family metallo-endopeptidase [Actinotignum schaalii]MDE1557751.1 ImmA/IrrE family metallo-endopeptidase [Actinotignum schaalii]MDE1662880.1 ImmA/IrrE family metallo-endopeptidase [Actinotignum schaalii]MDK6373666.1 ImmA/IrrE family metallo-endopeptidase [Actinotignum timonense]MDK6418252.1 ImmA/IrrE family metallo-endopeptidase [Actinotignum timonense]
MTNEEIARKTATQFRREYDLGCAPILSVTRLVEHDMNIGVAFVNTPAPGHGMIMSLKQRQLIAVGCADDPLQLRFMLAHELGHLKLGHLDRKLTTTQEWGKRAPQEIQADAFARHLLLPLDAATAVARDKKPSAALLSDVVQNYLVTPAVAAIQLRDVDAIDQATCQEWRAIPAVALATKFGWLSEYRLLSALSQQPRAPQHLLARTLEGYRWGAIGPAAIALLTGRTDYQTLVEEIHAVGIIPVETPDVTAATPRDTGTELTAQELALLKGHSDLTTQATS